MTTRQRVLVAMLAAAYAALGCVTGYYALTPLMNEVCTVTVTGTGHAASSCTYGGMSSGMATLTQFGWGAFWLLGIAGAVAWARWYLVRP